MQKTEDFLPFIKEIFNGSDDSQRDHFCDSLDWKRVLGKRNFLAIAEDFNIHVGGSAEDHEDQRRDYGLEVSSKEDGRILEFCAALVTCESGLSKTQVDYFFG